MTVQSDGWAMCPVCDKQYIVELFKEPDWKNRHARHEAGAFVQTVWPSATPTHREQITSGVCSDDCWDELFPPEEEEG